MSKKGVKTIWDKSGDYGMGENDHLWKENHVLIGEPMKRLTFFTLSIRY